MRIKRARIQNFRCLNDVNIDFDDVTTLIGPNGTGKSSVIRALDWFFNGENAFTIDEEDIYEFAHEQKIVVEVEFNSLTEADREQLGKYAPHGRETTTVWRIWENGNDKVVGKARAYPAFQEVRSLGSAAQRREKYNEIRRQNPDMNLPSASNDTQVSEAMDQWEYENPGMLEDSYDSATNFFGFVGQAKMSGYFDFMFISADMKAEEETSDNKTAILGRILQRSVDRTSADSDLEKLAAETEKRHNEIYENNFSDALEDLSTKLTSEISAFTTNRAVKLAPQTVEIKPPKAQFRVRVEDEDQEIDTTVDRQGHGFQRALLIAALKTLSQYGESETEQGTVCIAIEEPELFQHPLQAKAFASILRKLAEDHNQQIQIVYATHSPYFVEARRFNQIRRLNLTTNGSVELNKATVDEVVRDLSGFMNESDIRRRIDRVCLENLPTALFSSKVLLVEGFTDAGVLEGCSMRSDRSRFDIHGVAATPVGNKPNLLLVSSILKLLKIPTYIVFDGDKGFEQRMRNDGKNENQIKKEAKNLSSQNRQVLQYIGADEEEWPETGVYDKHAVFEDNLEAEIEEWAGWDEKRQELINEGLGFGKKDSITYRETSVGCEQDPPPVFSNIVEKVKNF